MARLFVIFCAGAAGMGMAARHIFTLPPMPGGDPPLLEILVACAKLYGTAYLTGRLLYRLIGSPEEAAELQGWSWQHMVYLNSACGIWLIVASNLQPEALLLGVATLGLALADLRKNWTQLVPAAAAPAAVAAGLIRIDHDGRAFLGGVPFTGTVERHDAQGGLLEQRHYLLGWEEGSQRSWYENGQLASEEFVRQRRPHGWRRLWFSNGQLKCEIFHEHGLKVSAKYWDEQGNALDKS